MSEIAVERSVWAIPLKSRALKMGRFSIRHPSRLLTAILLASVYYSSEFNVQIWTLNWFMQVLLPTRAKLQPPLSRQQARSGLLEARLAVILNAYQLKLTLGWRAGFKTVRILHSMRFGE